VGDTICLFGGLLVKKRSEECYYKHGRVRGETSCRVCGAEY